MRISTAHSGATTTLQGRPLSPATVPRSTAQQEGGTYYLPYCLHASPEQFARAYPQGREFFERKRAYDPDELFHNEF